MPSQMLTELFIKNATAPTTSQVDYRDKKIPGLACRVSSSGRKTWVFLYKVGRLNRRLTMGAYPELSLAEARRRASKFRVEVADGKDPATEKRLRHSKSFTFKELVDQFIVIYARQQNKAWKENERILNRDFVSMWGKRDIESIKKSDINDIIDKILSNGTPSAADHAFRHIRKLFNWSVERGYLASSPCQNLRSPTQTKSRDRVLTDEELSAIWKAAVKMGYPYGHLVKLLILTGQRLNEAAGMHWSEINTDQKIWLIPRTRTKAAREHLVPLTPEALELVQSIRPLHEKLVFPARNSDNPISGFSKWKRKIDLLSGTKNWRIHDIRRTVATTMAKEKVPREVIERVQNRLSWAAGGVHGSYNRYDYLTEKREALETWSRQLATLTLSTE